ncbi:glycine zipper domain-containing protein [Geobacter sp.]|uniref:glycine zipper domain-containing protein n=1 Tax=Geobacter sp. TaxID=46610 RepID=UPI00262D203C|nr:glycine zipper domain-containing protein [Geobacter sp.]
MKRSVIALATLAAFTFTTLTGCVTVPEEHKGAAKGAGYGAAAGAIAGAVLAGEGSRTKGAVLGGLAGALIGGVIGNYTIDKKQTAEQTAARYNFQPSSGTMVRVENVSVTPTSVRPGDKVEIQTTYALLIPTADAQTSVTESVELRHEGELVGNPETIVTHGGGTYTSTIPIVLPPDAKTGTYRVTATVKTESGRDTRETTFTVR